MSNSNKTSAKLKKYLSALAPENVVGASGLAILSACSLLAFTPGTDQTLSIVLSSWLGGLGLNVLAGVLQDNYKGLLDKRIEDEEKIIALAELLSKDIRQKGELRIEVGKFLNSMDAIDISLQIVKGNPALHGWLLIKIYEDVLQYQLEFDRIHKALQEIKTALDYKNFPEKDSVLELVDISVLDKRGFSVLDIKIRNIGNAVAFAKRIEIEMLERKATGWMESQYPVPVLCKYHILLDFPAGKSKAYNIAHQIEPNGVDRFQIILGSIEPDFVYCTVKLKIHYNANAVIQSEPIKLKIQTYRNIFHRQKLEEILQLESLEFLQPIKLINATEEKFNQLNQLGEQLEKQVNSGDLTTDDAKEKILQFLESDAK